jgi:solute carrier family 25 (mitochondrial carrier), member 14/30
MLKVDLKPIIPFINGGLASMIAESFTFPIDLVKTRLQLQGQKHDIQNSNLKYRGFIHGIRTVFKEEGITALYSGVKPALLRQATYGTLKMGFYQSLKKTFLKDNKSNNFFIFKSKDLC